MNRVLTVVRTDDGRILVTDSDDVPSVIMQAVSEGVEIDEDYLDALADDPNYDDPYYFLDQTEESYILISQAFIKG